MNRNPIGSEKPHVYLQNLIKSKYKVVLEVYYGNGAPKYHPVTDKPYMNYCIVQAYNNVDDARAGRDMIEEAVSYCSEKDNYDRHLGLLIALRRLNKQLKKAEQTSGFKFKN